VIFRCADFSRAIEGPMWNILWRSYDQKQCRHCRIFNRDLPLFNNQNV